MSSQTLLAVEHRIDTEGRRGSDQRERILQCRDQLVEELRRSLKEIISGPGATKGATASICSSLTILGDSSTVRSQLGNHLRHQLVQLTEEALASFGKDDDDERKQEENARLHETALSKLFNCVDRLTREHIESSRHRRLSSSSNNEENESKLSNIKREDNVFRQQLLLDMHKECDVQATRIVESYLTCRKLRERAQDVPAMETSEMADTVLTDLDIILDEMAVMAQHAESYNRYVNGMLVRLGKEMSEVDKSSESSTTTTSFDAMKEIAKSTNLQIAVQEMAGIFILIDSVFMKAGISRAHRLEEITKRGSPQYTSAVEDVFFLVQKCSRRAIATGHGDIACAVFNNINNTLNEDLYQLFVPRADRISSRQGTEFQLKQNKQAGIVVANSLDIASDFCHKLQESLSKETQEIWPITSTTQNSEKKSVRRKLGMCLEELDNLASAFSKAAQRSTDSLCNVLQLRSLVESVIPKIHYELKVSEYEMRRGKNDFAILFVGPLREAIEQFTNCLTEENVTRLSKRVASTVVTRLLRQIMRKRFNQLGALQLDSDVRLLGTVFRTFLGRAETRKVLQRLTFVVAFLNVETPEDACDVAFDARKSKITVTTDQVRRVLSLRVEFSEDDVGNVDIDKGE